MILETERLILRDWELKDVHDLAEGLNDIEVSRWLAFVPHPYTITDAEKWVSYCSVGASAGEERSSYHLAIELKSENKVIGGLSLNKISRSQGTAGGGIWLSSKYHGSGYGAEAFNRRIEFAFNELNLRRIENGYFDGNDASARMQEKLGYKIEGLRRKGFVCIATGEIVDECTTGLLKEEWVRNV